MDYLEYKGYKGSVEYCLFGKVQGLSKELISYEGQTLDELRKDFEEGIVKRPTKPRHKETEAATDFRFSIFSFGGNRSKTSIVPLHDLCEI